MNIHGRTGRTSTSKRARFGAAVGVFALLAAACASTAGEDSSAEATVEESSDASADEVLEITIGGGLTVVVDVAEVPDGELDVEAAEGGTCASGADARTPFTLPIPSESATAQLGPTDTVIFQRLMFGSTEDAAVALEMFGPGNCEAVVETVDGVPADGFTIVEDQALELAAAPAFPTATALVSDPAVSTNPAGLLLMQNGREIVLVVAIAPTVDEITAALEAAAVPYS